MLPTKTNEGYAESYTAAVSRFTTWMVILSMWSLCWRRGNQHLLMLEKCNHTQNGHELDVNTIKMNLQLL